MSLPFAAWPRRRSGQSWTVTRENETHVNLPWAVSYCPAQPRRWLRSLGSLFVYEG